MNTQKQNSKKQGVFFLLNINFVIIFLVLFFITGCNKNDDNSGKLEVIGKTYLLESCYYYAQTNSNFPMLIFYSSDGSRIVEVALYGYGGPDLPVGTFSYKKYDKTHIMPLVGLHLGFEWKYAEDYPPILKISKSKNNYNITLTGKIYTPEFDDVIHEYKLTYKGSHY